MRSKMLRAMAVIGLTVALSGCSADQFAAWLRSAAGSPDQHSKAELEYGAAIATQLWQTYLAEWQDLTKFDWVLSDGSLARLRQCESGGNYHIVSPGGHYRGAYQFHRTTWNSVAGRHYPKYVGIDPAAAAPKIQDSMARALFYEQGRGPWPHCGKLI